MSANLAAWQEILDRFERALDAPADTAPQPLAPPPGPPPHELVERARAVLARQQMRMAELTASQAEIGREIAALRRVPSAHASTPAFLDIEG
ncbi:hypothetical protein GCM10022219_03950 [Microbacterium oryzae]|uniref:Uncharacterized protein n=1 Tax=Microbacterium oryzae TaxID=743009 RepID=A0A6I6DX27_9MICO|nr:hypothetical protein [Microbacterium oryzae]QGU26544.1 hypothetical protein D7D94_01725 [Microbacterium oryzae]